MLYKYKAFISYSHTADGRLAPSLQSSLQRFAKPWFSLHAIRVFRDATGLGVTPALWPSIEKALGGAEYFLLLASPQAATSKWVDQEVAWWLQYRTAESLLIVWTDGELKWDEANGDFDWAMTNCLPRRLGKVFQHEPRYLNLGWARTATDLSLRNPKFLNEIAALSSTLRDRPLDELIGDDVREHRRTRQLVRAVVAGLLTLTLLAVGTAAFAIYERRIARQQARVAFSRELAASATALAPAEIELSIALALKGLEIASTSQAEDVLRNSLLASRILKVLQCRKGPLAGVAFSPDGRRILTVNDDHTATSWEAAAPANVVELRGHSTPLGSAAFSSTGKWVLTETADYGLRISDSASGKTLTEVRLQSEASAVDISPDGRRVLTVGWDYEHPMAEVRDAETGKVVSTLRGHTDRINWAAFSPEGNRVVTASGSHSRGLVISHLFTKHQVDNSARVWEATSGRQLAELRGHAGSVISAAFSLDGKWIVTAGDDSTARLWDAATGECRAVFRGHSGAVWYSAFSSDGNRIVTAGDDHTARIWDVTTGDTLIILIGHSKSVNCAAFSPDGRQVVTGSADETARVWDASTRRGVIELRGHRGAVKDAAFSPDARLAVTVSDDRTARTWDTATGAPVANLGSESGSLHGARFSPDGKWVLTIHDDVRFMGMGGASLFDIRSPNSFVEIWEAATGKSVATLRGHTNEIKTASFSADGRMVLTASSDRTARLWEAATGRSVAELRGHTRELTDASLSPNGRLAATASKDDTARLWEVSTGHCLAVLRGHPDTVHRVVFSPDSKWILTASDEQFHIFGKAVGSTARIWEAATGKPVNTLIGLTASVSIALFSPDGTRVLTVGPLKKSAQLWDRVTGRRAAELLGHSEAITCAAFSPDGELIATGSDDSTVRVWRTATGEGLSELRDNRGSIAAVEFSADGRMLITATGEWSNVRPYAADNTARLYPWGAFAPIQDLLDLARHIARPLEIGERTMYLHEPLPR